MRVLGIDPGLTRCGMGVVEGDVGRPLRLVDVNVLRTSADEHVSLRLVHIERGIEAWLDEHRPDAVAIERVFARSDSSTVMGTAQASGIAMVAAARRGLPIALHTPSEVKAAVSGSGRADKAQVGAMVTRILRLDAPPKPADAADALALAITHIWRGGAQARIDAAVARSRQEAHGDRVRPRRGRRGDSHQRRRSRSVASASSSMCTPEHPGHAAHRPAATLPDVDGRARGLPDALRLRRRGREAGLRAGADRQRGRPQAGPGDAGRPHARRRTPCGRRRRRPHADRGARASGRRAPSGSSSSSRTGSASPAAVGPAAAYRCCRSRGASRCSRAWSGSGWSAKDADQAIDAVADQAGDQPDVAALLRAALRSAEQGVSR